MPELIEIARVPVKPMRVEKNKNKTENLLENSADRVIRTGHGAAFVFSPSLRSAALIIHILFTR